MAHSNLSDSIHQSSDEINEMHCEQCDQHGISTTATGYCVDCAEYMCTMCLVYHSRYKPAHTQQNAANMPQDFCLERCSIHPKHVIKYFCITCDALACNNCKVNDHNNCENVRHIPELATHDNNRKELQELDENIDFVSKELDKVNIKIDLNTQQIGAQEREVKSAMKMHKENMISTFKYQKQEMEKDYDEEISDAEQVVEELKLKRQETITCFAAKERTLEKNLADAEKDTVQKVEARRGADESNLQLLRKQNIDMAKGIEGLTSDIEQQRIMGQRCNAFIATKKAQQVMDCFQDDLQVMKTTNKTSNYNVKLDTKSITFETVETVKNCFCYSDINEQSKIKSALFHSDIQIQPLGFTSLCLISDNELIVADHKSSHLFIISNLKDITLVCQKMPSAPWGIARVNNDKIAITFPDEEVLRILTVSKDMLVSITEDVIVGYDCYGVAYGHDRLIVSFLNPAKIQMLDISGNVLRTVDKDSANNTLLSSPKQLAMSSDKRIIYVADSNKNTVTSITLGGKVKAVYKNDQLTGPFQITTDEDGLVYVCARGSNNVHQLSCDLTQGNILLDDRQGVVKPVSVAFCDTNNKLYIGMYNSDIIKVFNIVLEFKG